MTRDELEMYAQRYLEKCEPKIRALQSEINREFVKTFGANPGLATITEHKEHWVHSQLGSFTTGFVLGMNRKPSKAEDAMLRMMLGLLSP